MLVGKMGCGGVLCGDCGCVDVYGYMVGVGLVVIKI